jgi:hypothetical protein
MWLQTQPRARERPGQLRRQQASKVEIPEDPPITKDQIQVGDIIHAKCARNSQPYNRHDAQVLSCSAKLVKVSLVGLSVYTENKYAYANIPKLVSKAAAASDLRLCFHFVARLTRLLCHLRPTD